jgi:hypothetical protein
MQKYNLQKNPLKQTKILSKYYNFVTNLKFQHKPKYHFFSKNPHIKIDLLLLPSRGQNPFKLLYSIIASKHNNNLAFLVVGKANFLSSK